MAGTDHFCHGTFVLVKVPGLLSMTSAWAELLWLEGDPDLLTGLTLKRPPLSTES